MFIEILYIVAKNGNNLYVLQQVNGLIIVVHSYNGIIVSNKNEQTTNIRNNLDDSLENFTEYKKPVPEVMPPFI